MGKPKKLTVKIFENRELKEVKTKEPVFYPLYLVVTYNRKVTKFKSPTYDFILNQNIGYELITENQEAIRINDERLISNYKKYLESKNIEFSVSLLKSDNQEFEEIKTPLEQILNSKLISALFKFFNAKKTFINTTLLMAETENINFFINAIAELNNDVFEQLRSIDPDLFNAMDELRSLERKNIFPFYIDHLVDEQFLSSFRKVLFQKSND